MIRDIKSGIHLRYTGINEADDSCLELTELGKSLIGFDKLFHELVKITKINGDVSIKATAYRDGSIIVDLLMNLQGAVDFAPFDKVSDLLDYLKFTNEAAWEEAVLYFQEISSKSKTVYGYLSKHPVELTSLSIVLVKLVEYARRNKDKPCLNCEDLPKRIAIALHRLIQKQRCFKRALIPLVEDTAASIEISHDRKFKKAVSINQNNFHEYLGEDEKILDHLENGISYKLHGAITSMKSTRGDSLTFKYIFNRKTYNLDLYPPDGATTKRYTDFYKENVVIEAEVVRMSSYKKPKLKLQAIDFIQKKLFIKEKNKTEPNAEL